ncbi:MAG: Rrf2 family transcriptional regulator [Deltaproteobacteria bacterium]|nr:Rrf2 family transcriptional regulator [Deltaproteobacteria bacterium]
MIHFNKKTEYALLAIEYMVQKEGLENPIVNTREISEACQIPYAVLAKILQKLAVKGIIKSIQGTKGGYILARRGVDISVAQMIEIFDGPFAVAECFNGEKITCPQWSSCHIKTPFSELNHKIYTLLSQTTLADLASKKSVPDLSQELR